MCWFGLLVRMPPGSLLVKSSGHVPPVGAPQEDPGHAEEESKSHHRGNLLVTAASRTAENTVRVVVKMQKPCHGRMLYTFFCMHSMHLSCTKILEGVCLSAGWGEEGLGFPA